MSMDHRLVSQTEALERLMKIDTFNADEIKTLKEAILFVLDYEQGTLNDYMVTNLEYYLEKYKLPADLIERYVCI